MTRSADNYRCGELLVDARRRVLQVGGEAVGLQPKVFDTLLFLVRNCDRVVSKDELLDTLWPGTIVTEDSLTRVVSALRKALGDSAAAPRLIRAVRGVGYRFIGEVETVAAPLQVPVLPRSLAVFPFRPVGSGQRDESLELGMADTLISRLSALPELVVRPIGAVRDYLEAGVGAHERARALRVDAYLEATLQMSETRLRVNARLVSTADGSSLWSATFDEGLSHIFEVQDGICDRIVASLTPRVTGEVAAPRTSLMTPEVYRKYLEGRLFHSRETEADLQRAIECFESALDAAPDHAEAWVGLGECQERLATDRGGDVLELAGVARRAARRALALAPGLPEAERLLATITWRFDWDEATAGEIFERALARSPNRADLHIACSDFLCMFGRAAEGVEHARRALSVDPVSPWCSALLAQALYMDGRFSEARSQSEHALRLEPGFHFGLLFGGLAAFCEGDQDRGIALVEEAVRSGRRDFYAALGLCYGKAGRAGDARRVLGALVDQGERVPAFALALAHLGCGEVDEALAWLARCIEQRNWHALLFRADPLFAEYREQPRFRELLAGVGRRG